MQLRRVLLLFALVLGLSAVVASIVPPPDTREERDREPAGPAEPAGRPDPGPSGTLAFTVPADPRAPARFDLVARPRGRYAVVFLPLRGRARIVGKLEFVDVATVRPRAPGG